ncbi:MAG TPA: hypothetical protein PL033_09575 [Candidatus Brocadiia bacterium]|nr:hypothetical protein [Candidatus Brocadiia bacterium]
MLNETPAVNCRTQRLSLIAAATLFAISTWVLCDRAMRMCDSRLVYPLDDAYIHMAMARNYAQHGVFGVTRHEFTSSTSSPLWTFLLGWMFMAFGPDERMPLILNVIFGICCIAAFWLAGKRHFNSGPSLTLAATGVTMLIPLPIICFCGMEHTLHVLLSFLFVFSAVNYISRPEQSRAGLARTAALACLCCAVRYEGLMLTAVICCMLLLRRRILPAILIGAAAWTVPVIYGTWSMNHGWMFFPTSVVLKGGMASRFKLAGLFDTVTTGFLNKIYLSGMKIEGWQAVGPFTKNPHIVALMCFALILVSLRWKGYRRLWTDAISLSLLIVCAATFLHLTFARTGWLYRYEAYLMALGIFWIFAGIAELCRESGWLAQSGKDLLPKATLALALLIAACPLLLRATGGFSVSCSAAMNIYEQPYQIARFINRFFNGNVVAVNDIGAVNFFNDIECVDLGGLASLPAARAMMSRTFNSETVRRLTEDRGVRIAVFYDHWLLEDTKFGSLPPAWIKIGEWEIQDNTICGHNVVSFFATDPQSATQLRGCFRDFRGSLPSRVIVRESRVPGQ